MPLWLLRAWSWLKRNWAWLLLPVGVLLYIVKKSSVPHVLAPELQGASEKQREIDAQLRKDEQAALDEKTNSVEALDEAYEKDLAEIRERQEQQGDLLKDPDALNLHLREVGKKLRK